MAQTRGKRIIISVTSSSSEDEEEVEDSDDDDDGTSNPSTSDDGSEWNTNEEMDEEADRESIEDDDSVSTTPADSEIHYNKVINLLKGGHDLQALKLEECKAYLRKHGLRLTGTKTICAQRIQEHWRIKEGNGEKLYPRSSFVMNCTGDVCKGDVVLFTQRVYEKFDKVTRGGHLLGKRTIAGRVVKESYGAAKQQHTFTIEVLWSKGMKKLLPLFPLLVKGRNLYRLRTFRQRWDNEAERSKVLAEKHKRGAAARSVRTFKKMNSVNGGAKCPRDSHRTRRPVKRQRNQESRPTVKAREHSDVHRKDQPSGQWKTKRVAMPRDPKSLPRHLKQVYPNGNNNIPSHYLNTGNGSAQNQYWTQMQFHPMSTIPSHPSNGGAHYFPNYEIGSSSTARRMPPFKHYRNPMIAPAVQNRGFTVSNHRYPRHQLDPINHGFQRQSYAVPVGAEMHRGWKNGSMPCSTPWCRELGAKNCVVSSCWRCCRGIGRRCIEHQAQPY